MSKRGRGRRRGGGGREKKNEPFFKILDPRYTSLSIDDHFAKEICETRAAEFRIARSVEVAVVNRFAVGRGAEAGAGRGGEGWFGGEGVG